MSDAPRADDDGSGTALALELARVVAAEQPGQYLFRRRADSVACQRIQRFPKTGSIVLKEVLPGHATFAVSTVAVDGNEDLPVCPSKLE